MKNKILEVLSNYSKIQKCSTPGSPLVTEFSEVASKDYSYLEEIIKNADSKQPLLSQMKSSEAREVVIIADFMAVCHPDLESNDWDGEALKVASKLRSQYFEVFGEKAYKRGEL